MQIRQGKPESRARLELAEWQQALISRRRFLLGMAGGSLACLFPWPRAMAKPNPAEADASVADPWALLAAVQERLLPSEPQAPGAREINALAYLRGVVKDEHLPAEDRQFILLGAGWLDALSREVGGPSFVALEGEAQDALLRRIETSDAGENWLSTLLLYLFEALLTDPVYGGNPDGIGWRWLGHTPGFPRPPADKTYWRLG